ncbi:TylF/MycF/NovP-related O-methyltransferase [Flectobacillus sp. BAB-3569]|uniref:TylF/MycF/NovP-related O-methyltransferase n=1 Tax=Flectobacillus sp. BAB-3569 TaxID=1509483 RepID=UPI000BA2FA04|nr:TylF/MycF/NovP-related O-methyltransferase [Flectobacillus sp. BAB-3569]PAC31496.1 macrocin O-methyltransferase [Flectobacillus sp. BAB-3569]
MISKLLKPFGYKIAKVQKEEDFINDPTFLKILKACQPYTMTSIERMYALYNAVTYIVKNNIAGSFVECGVWRGGSSMMIALTLKELGVSNRSLYLYDTYEGMSEPTADDVDFRGGQAKELMEQNVENKQNSVWCLADLNDVQNNMRSTGYPQDLVHFVKGKVEDTIPATMPDAPIALLRLDTDWYESTAHELKYLYPLLIQKGVLVIDDYGHWEGCKRAVDEYFNGSLLLNRIDYTGRIAIKS